MLSFLQELKCELLRYMLAMLESGKVEDENFEMWGKGFCDRMVSAITFHRVFRCNNMLGRLHMTALQMAWAKNAQKRYRWL